MIVLTTCLAMFKRTLSASERRKDSCHGSGSKPKEAEANSMRSLGTAYRRERVRALMRRTSRLSNAVLTLELLYLGRQPVGFA